MACVLPHILSSYHLTPAIAAVSIPSGFYGLHRSIIWLCLHWGLVHIHSHSFDSWPGTSVLLQHGWVETQSIVMHAQPSCARVFMPMGPPLTNRKLEPVDKFYSFFVSMVDSWNEVPKPFIRMILWDWVPVSHRGDPINHASLYLPAFLLWHCFCPFSFLPTLTTVSKPCLRLCSWRHKAKGNCKGPEEDVCLALSEIARKLFYMCASYRVEEGKGDLPWWDRLCKDPRGHVEMEAFGTKKWQDLISILMESLCGE